MILICSKFDLSTCMYVCMHVCMYICMYIYTYVNVFIYAGGIFRLVITQFMLVHTCDWFAVCVSSVHLSKD